VTDSVGKIGIMGGSFDPIHYGHLMAAEECRRQLALDRVVFVPTGISSHKSGCVASSEDRYAMTLLAVAEFREFSVSRTEVDRPCPSHTVDTLSEFLGKNPAGSEFFFITGLDAMLEEVKSGNVAVVIIKDQSRIGRDVLEVGLLKRTFEEYDVRFIAANDNLDTANGFDIMSIFRDVINEWYVADTSKKIRAVKQAQGKAGERLAVIPPYGYRKDPDNPKQLIIDDEAAEVVRRMGKRSCRT